MVIGPPAMIKKGRDSQSIAVKDDLTMDFSITRGCILLKDSKNRTHDDLTMGRKQITFPVAPQILRPTVLFLVVVSINLPEGSQDATSLAPHFNYRWMPKGGLKV
ncbi:MAG: hypothetical protein HQK58_15145 [Deltaproteobacteria bacterium]|nr:hypothetical protein [Deltaproteobacteria bacterium]